MQLYRNAARCCLAGWLLVQGGCGFSAHAAPVSLDAYECDCECTSAPITFVRGLGQGEDDAEENLGNNAVNLAGLSLDMGAGQVVGIRFPNLGIPKGATIHAAHIQFRVSVATTGPASFSVFGQAADNAPIFAATTGNLTGRPRTSAFVTWTPADWPTVDASGPAQASADLTSIVQELVNRPNWAAANAMAFLISGTGVRSARSFEAAGDTAPTLEVTYTEPVIPIPLATCMPPDLNPYLNDAGTNPSEAQLVADCETRVENTLRGMTEACGYPGICNCQKSSAIPVFADACQTACVEVPLAPGCSNFNPAAGVTTATNAPGDSPVCTTHSPLSSALFGQHSTCDVSGHARVEVPDEDTKTPAANGSIELTTSGCPGSNCAVGMTYDLALDPVTYDHTFGSATFRDLGAIGESVPGGQAVLANTGAGSFDPNSTQIAARGRRGSDQRAFLGTNDNPIDVTASFVPGAASCSLSGTLAGTADPEAKRCEDSGQPTANEPCTTDADCTVDDQDNTCTDGICNCLPFASQIDMTLSLDVSGPIVNQPPLANAGADQTVECDSPGRASVTLDALQSSDPDGNFASFRWFQDTHVGPVVGSQPRVTLEQTLNAQVAYVFRVIDGFGQADEDTTQVKVVDTTPPVIACNTPATIAPPRTPLSFRASASDVCDSAVTPELVSFSCVRFANGKPVDKTFPCDVTLDGPTITIGRSLGVGNHIVFTARALDDSGNQAERSCEVVVVQH